MVLEFVVVLGVTETSWAGLWVGAEKMGEDGSASEWRVMCEHWAMEE